MDFQFRQFAELWSAWETGLSLFGFLGMGPTELGIVCVIAVVLFGNRLPGAMRGIGSALRGFREEVRESSVALNAATLEKEVA
jgi:TatA/E family protein of Tat protein translocase